MAFSEISKMPKKALVIDNDFFFLEFLSELLEKRGYEVLKAHDGKEGISRLNEGPIDFLFLEIIMPKIDGKQVIKYARNKFPEDPFHIIAVSGYLVEQMDELNDIGADFYIAKGAMEKMGEHVDAFMDTLENGTFETQNDGNIFLEPGQVYPRQTTAHLLDMLYYFQAILESAGIGILILDKDAKIINANPYALKIIDNSLENILNQSITRILTGEDKEVLANHLKKLFRDDDNGKVNFLTHLDSKEIRTSLTVLSVKGKKTGWIVTLEDGSDNLS